MRALRLSLVWTVILALLGGLAGATVAHSEGSDATEFPTGTLLAVAEPALVVEFHEDWTGSGKSYAEGWENQIRYATNGDLFTEMTHEGSRAEGARDVVPGLRWGAAELRGLGRGHALRSRRHLCPHVHARQDPVEVVVAAPDVPAGETVHATWAITGIAPAVQVEASTCTDYTDVLGSTATVEIVEGQPITPDMLEPSAE